MKVYNPKPKKNQDLFETKTLIPVFTVSCGHNSVSGDKGARVYFTVDAENEEDAKDKALANPHFTKHLIMKDFKRKDLSVHVPTGLYVIGRVDYYEGDPRL